MRISVLAAALLAVALLGPGQALAAPPTNDAFADAATLTLPASPFVDLTEATTEAGEPGGGCWQHARSAWYRLQPATDTLVRFSSTGPFDRVVDVYRDTGSGLTGLTSIGCAYPWSSLETELQGGSTYYVQLGAPPWSSVSRDDHG